MVGFPSEDEEEEGENERASRAAVVMRMSEAVSVLADASIVLGARRARGERETGSEPRKLGRKASANVTGHCLGCA